MAHSRSANCALSPEQDILVAERYGRGECAREIGESLGVGKKAVLGSLKRSGVVRRTNAEHKFKRDLIPAAMLDEMARRYRAGTTLQQLSQESGVGSGEIRLRLRKRGVHIRTWRESHPARRSNERFFACIDTPAKAYSLGLILADGCIAAPHSMRLGLHVKDAAVVESVRKAMGSESSIHRYRDEALLIVTSPRICSDLELLGCVRRKSYHGTFPSIPPHLRRYMVLGLFDGDGSIGGRIGKYGTYVGGRWNIVGTESICRGIAKVIKEEIGVETRVFSTFREKSTVPLWHVATTRINPILSICAWMYGGAPIKMPRKWAQYAKLKRDRE
jgi:hypothetical protein